MKPVPELGARERRVLLLGSRLELDGGARREFSEALLGGIDGETLLFHARLHSVGSLLYRHLRNTGEPPTLARDVMAGFLRLCHAAEYRNRLFAAENARVLAALDAARIPVIVPKGISLLEEIYGKLALRPLIDLIFLVPPHLLRETRAVFAELGYREKPPRAVDGLYRWSCPQILFEARGAMRVQVLVLWHLMTWPRVHSWAMEGIWERARSITLSGRQARVLSPEDLLLYLCVQADNHGVFNRAAIDVVPAEHLAFALWSNNRIIRFTDVFETARRHRDAFSWQRFTDGARAAGVEESAHASLRLTHALLGEIAPAEVLETLRGGASGRVRGWFARTMVPELRTADVGVFRRALGARLTASRPYWQLRLSRFIGLAEFAFPGPEGLSRRYGARGRAAVNAAAVLHATWSIARALRAFLFLAVARRAPNGTRTSTGWSGRSKEPFPQSRLK